MLRPGKNYPHRRAIKIRAGHLDFCVGPVEKLCFGSVSRQVDGRVVPDELTDAVKGLTRGGQVLEHHRELVCVECRINYLLALGEVVVGAVRVGCANDIFAGELECVSVFRADVDFGVRETAKLSGVVGVLVGYEDLRYL